MVVGGSTQPVNLEEIPEKSSGGMDDEFLNKQPESDKVTIFAARGSQFYYEAALCIF